MYFKHFNTSVIFKDANQLQADCCCRAGGLDSLLTLLQVLDAFMDNVDYRVFVSYAFGDASKCDYEQHYLYQAIDIFSVNNLRKTYFDLLDFLNRSSFKSYVGDLVLTDKFIHIGLRTASHKNFLHYEKRNRKNSD